MNTVKILSMRAADKPAVMAILHSTPEFLPHEVVVAEELIDAFLTSSKSGYRILVAKTDNRVVGYVCYGETPLTTGTWDVYWIAVGRNTRGKGVGWALMEATENEIKKLRGRLVVIETSTKPDYNKTRQFYIMQGYSEIAIIPDFYTVGDSKVIMVKRLN